MPQITDAQAYNPVVKVFVRLGDREREYQREIAFRIPDGIDALDLLDQGFAIDGNRAVSTVAEYVDDANIAHYYGPFDVSEPTLSGALAESQRALVAYLRDKGFVPQFA